jgi:hypothetical protein
MPTIEALGGGAPVVGGRMAVRLSGGGAAGAMSGGRSQSGGAG